MREDTPKNILLMGMFLMYMLKKLPKRYAKTASCKALFTPVGQRLMHICEYTRHFPNIAGNNGNVDDQIRIDFNMTLVAFYMTSQGHRKKSKHERSGVLGCQAMEPPRLIHYLRTVEKPFNFHRFRSNHTFYDEIYARITYNT